MNSNQQTQQDVLGSIVPQLQGMSLSGASTPMMDTSSTPLHKPGSLLGTLGIQRANSPFVGGGVDGVKFGRQPHDLQYAQHGQQTPHQAYSGLRETPSSSSLAADWAQQSSVGNAAVPNSNSGLSGTSIDGHSSFGLSMVDALGVPSNVPPPPGVFAPHMPILESQWKYVDFQNIVQGPFPSQSMTNWYQAGYLQASLQIARVATSPEPFGVNEKFASLGDLMAKVGDFADPFSKFDLIVAQAQAQVQMQPQLNPRLPQQLSLDSLQVANGTSGNASDPITFHLEASSAPVNDAVSSGPQIESLDYTHDQLLELRDSDGGYFHETISQIPVHKFVENDAAPKSYDTKTRQTIDQDALQRRREYETLAKQRKEQQLAQEKLQKYEQLKQQQDAVAAAEVERRRVLVSETEGIAKQRQKQREEEAERRKKADESARRLLEEEHQRFVREQQETEDRNKRDELEKLRRESSTPSGASSPALLSAKPAPWANKTKASFAGPSLAEIQQKEAAQRAKRKQEQEHQTREIAAKLQQQVFNEEASKPRIDSIATWASKKLPNQPLDEHMAPVKTIEQIQKEQAEQKKFLAEQKRLWEEVQKNAKVNVAPSSTDVNEWTTVTKKQVIPLKASSTKNPNQANSYLSPDKLRSMSANSSKQIGSSTSIPTLKTKVATKAPVAYSGNASTSLRQEFLKWCKSQMKLSQEVNVNGVLEFLLSLPAGPESKEIIADTIYSNSSSMDGRRFAAEFIKRRIDCEAKLTDSLSWSEALSMPEGDVEDWEFQVVGKKKNRKH
ncbi:LANO_0E07800g1_1 [Lachancea nothofagi CBS 11611]|uniref:LANO_0E07800g1_1 n=1 Tax=Lachancea nothofagi CBS 11611 TaxID=1266666 RepID=A0A1G4JUQ8_9SACH|nr:LANO_0E07800g1_1 [Lachancea nothofagi CBS 11611]